MKKYPDPVFVPKRCKFIVDTKKLIYANLIEDIINEIPDDVISCLNERINRLQIYVGGRHQRAFDKVGVKDFNHFNFDFNTKTLTLFLAKIFKDGFTRWNSLRYGALRRYIWDEFIHSLLLAFSRITRWKIKDMENGKMYNFFKVLYSSFYFLFELTNSSLNYMEICQKFWIKQIPKYLGFLEILYRKKISELKPDLSYYSHESVRYINELRKIKMRYEYEYALSELINFCLPQDYYNLLLRSNLIDPKKLRISWYNKCKRIILKEIKDKKLKVKRYKDSANRTFIFLKIKDFEKIEGICSILCANKLQNSQFDELNEFLDFFSHCPVCHTKNHKNYLIDFYFNENKADLKEMLIKNMEISENVKIKNLVLGIPCCSCYSEIFNEKISIPNHPSLTKPLFDT